ncbi:unnamed protein product [Prorocentrum cordatum]|uniref:Uncharacterized protein n=1 Tax=Prorocentrum cordatum TaxID=2364126 RepID=A0ABN9V6X3_9DINO|nr:unnamed protein product [Polarella glacialis]
MYRLARLPKHGSLGTDTDEERTPAGWTRKRDRLDSRARKSGARSAGCTRGGPAQAADHRGKLAKHTSVSSQLSRPSWPRPVVCLARRQRETTARKPEPHTPVRLGRPGSGSAARDPAMSDQTLSNKLSESVDRVAGGGPGRDARQRGRGGGGGGEGTRAQTAAAAEAPLRGHLPRSPTGGRGRRQCIVTPLGHHHVETLGKEEV